MSASSRIGDISMGDLGQVITVRGDFAVDSLDH